MNKNPFATAAYTPQQPPLPPGPPPPQPAQPDYSAYWAAAAAAQQAQAGAASAYSAQWSASQTAHQTAAAARPADQAQLYANYGYGANWQQQQQQQQRQVAQQQHQHYQPPAPVAQPPPPPPQAQAQYSPYQPQAAVTYQQPYVPPTPAQAVPGSAPPVPYQQGAPQQFQQPQQFFPQQQQQQHRQNRPPNPHHTSPQQFPPAKRQRFDAPNQHRGGPPPQPQFQPPPPPPVQQGGFNQGPNPYGRGGGPPAGGRGGYQGGRGGNMSGRGRGGSVGMTRGTTRGRGGGSYNNMGGRGGNHQGGGSFRGQGPNRGGYNNRDNRDNRRGGGSFNSQGYPHQQQNYHNNNQSHSSFRGRGQGFNHSSRGGRHDNVSTRSGDNVSTTSGSFSIGKRDENKRTLTDFKIVGLKLPDLDWAWGTLPEVVDSAAKDEAKPAVVPSDASAAVQPTDGTSPVTAEGVTSGTDGVAAVAATAPDTSAVKAEIEALLPPPPSRVRIYFHTPVSPDDAHPISQSSYGSSVSNARKGKRKKLEDDDGDYEQGRGAPPPPPHGGDFDGAGRDSVAPSVAETTSEGDWLMAAIGEEDGDGEGAENLHVSEVEHFLDNGDAGDGDYGNEYMQGDGHDGDQTMGDEDAQGSEVDPHEEHYTSFSAHGSHNHADHPLVNGDGHADTSSGSQEHPEGGAASATSQNNSNQNSQETVSSTPSVQALGANAPSGDDSSSTDPSSQNAAPNADVPQTASAVPQSVVSPLQAMDSMASTVPDTNQELAQTSPYASTIIDGGDAAEHQDYEATQPATQFGDEHASGAEGATFGGSAAANLLGEKIPSANRLSVSYAGATRRLVIDAEVVPKLKVFRAEGRIEVTVSLMADERGGFKGIAMEGCSEESTYVSLELTEQLESDVTVPPLWRAKIPSEVQLVLYLDKERPLSEPRWVKTGDVQEWLKSMFGGRFWVAGDAADGWERRVEVVDPDPAPTIWTVLESWASNSNVGQLVERQRFLRTHMVETDNILEILLRLVRGERSTFTQNAPITAPSVSGPLLSALSPGSAHGAQQTHVSLAVLAIFRLTVEYAKKAAGDKGQSEAEERVGEIIRSLPSHLIYKSLDGIFKEWRVEKKGGRAST
ncbi:hypothetical protein OH76DRAFT_1343770 [Lentinus brumalis]|uniref:Uncharacterized protein n=1 Tax=Lentinus brumalis TaxID=2498619 RepID=A0A371DKM1_9APHY|nr:hypothetical protein OH76DRAFT_1343770 [Polyporus brumalis]